jgi:hypothetical protein
VCGVGVKRPVVTLEFLWEKEGLGQSVEWVSTANIDEVVGKWLVLLTSWRVAGCSAVAGIFDTSQQTIGVVARYWVSV